ncbi:ester cyclase [Aliikangiella sp. G2MR2-5]|uniref:nuclear transport factor 2 family protein n=1 Tax=Aliikangiella sp. G2MR2-5 TaxID=2788943 RepID=UPI0018AB00D9|nr:nuclear transport factor 2 family protein [Aliikangiella sp. G2MR2-5]
MKIKHINKTIANCWLILLLYSGLSLPALAGNVTLKNKQLVSEFYQKFFVERDLSNAPNQYLSENYIQHNPYLASGRTPLVDFFQEYFKKFPLLSVDVKRVIADGDLVVVHSHWQKSKDENGSAVMDIFRIQDGTIVEHWDVVQAVTMSKFNTNGIF